MDKQLTFSYYNRKMRETASMLGLPYSHVLALDIPAGWSCPAASICKAKANRDTGKVTKGAHSQFLCYAAKAEALYPNVRRSRWNNFELIKASLREHTTARLILDSIPRMVEIIRIHSSGDFFNQEYFQAWVEVATRKPDLIFYGYTKVLACLLQERPSNMHLVYSHGGLHDVQSLPYHLPTCYVVQDEAEANLLNVPLSCTPDNPANDYYYIVNQESFAIKLH